MAFGSRDVGLLQGGWCPSRRANRDDVGRDMLATSSGGGLSEAVGATVVLLIMVFDEGKDVSWPPPVSAPSVTLLSMMGFASCTRDITTGLWCAFEEGGGGAGSRGVDGAGAAVRSLLALLMTDRPERTEEHK